MTKKRIHWLDLTKTGGDRYRVRRTATGWETAGGITIWWHPEETDQARNYLYRRQAGEKQATLKCLTCGRVFHRTRGELPLGATRRTKCPSCERERAHTRK